MSQGPDGHYTAGLDVGGTKCLGVLVDEQGAVVAETRVPTPRGADGLIDMLVAVFEDLSQPVGGVDAVGVGVPGLVSPEGVLRYAPNLDDVVELPVAALLRDRIEVPLFVDNDANCALWAEHVAGAAQGVGHAVLVTLGTGIGTGVLVDGRIVHGAHGFAGELGHVTVAPEGPLCACGRRGCLETMASGPGLARMARRLISEGRAHSILAAVGGDPSLVRGEHVARAARAGDPDALAVFDEFSHWLAAGLVTYTAVLDPELILVGGGVVVDVELFIDATRVAYDEMLLGSSHRPDTRIEPTALRERAGAIGAALFAQGLGHPA